MRVAVVIVSCVQFLGAAAFAQDAAAVESLAAQYLQTGQNRKAADMLAGYLQVHPGSARLRSLLAAAYLGQEDFEAAKRALGGNPADPAALLLLGMAELGLQDPVAAERLFREVLTRQPDSVDANFQLGMLYAKQDGHLREAIRLLVKARELKPDLAGVHTALGSAMLSDGKPAEAAKELESAIRLDPESAESYYVLADADRQLHRAAKADEDLAQFQRLQAAAADRRAREMRSRAYYEQGVELLVNTEQVDRAYQLFRKAVEETPALDAGYYRMAQVEYLRGELRQALSNIQKALELNSLEPEYHYVRARCLQWADREAALKSVKKAIELKPGVPDFGELRTELEKTK